MIPSKTVVLGGGAWGTTIANLLSNKGESVTVWTFEEKVVQDVKMNSENSFYLPGVKLNKKLTFTNSLEEAVEMAKDSPILKMGGTVEVRNIIPMDN